MARFKALLMALLQIPSTSLVSSSSTLGSCRNATPSFWPDGVAVDARYKSKTSKIIDYGTERADLPFFEVVGLEKPVQVELKFSEAFTFIDGPWSGGPYLFNTGQANSFRVETFNTTQPGCYRSSFVQGGQRWQAFRLLTDGSVTIKNVGLESSISMQIDLIKGAYIANQRPAMTINGPSFANYTLEFDAFIVRGGIWWAVTQPLALDGLQIQLTEEMPLPSSFVNVNKTVTPPNTLLLSSGFGFINQTTLPSYILATSKLPFSVKEKTWYRIKTVLDQEGKLEVLVTGRSILKVRLTDYSPGGNPASKAGPFGFGAWQD
ncbi:hypothetical protein F53441_2490 [Fusarium austroafricanum]|uniref:Uncharacterized protein n=1 Tax=Fusarium austroafricanum TaxID=2364996 RepID=A0A8H4KS28_9HYPO|nr:hypothetical protein F53441_2490 [Fusarium austroafricanum]